MKLLILNGPNLNLLGTREPEIYGSKSFDEHLSEIRKRYEDIEIEYAQSNHEGVLIDHLHQADQNGVDGIILNAGGYSHSSVALADAVSSISTPVVGVHISNIYQREEERHKELLSQYVKAGIYGMGLQGYSLAIEYLLAQN